MEAFPLEVEKLLFAVDIELLGCVADNVRAPVLEDGRLYTPVDVTARIICGGVVLAFACITDGIPFTPILIAPPEGCPSFP